jgi:hypothetical protein
MDNYDWDEAARMRGELLGVPARLFIKEDDRDAVREQRAQQQQQQQQLGTAATIAKLIGDAGVTQ